LGICPVQAAVRPDLRSGLSASDRERPLITGVNGPLMARRSWEVAPVAPMVPGVMSQPM
jgi:hypothetical protein